LGKADADRIALRAFISVYGRAGAVQSFSAKATGSDTFAVAGSGGLLSLTEGEERYTIDERKLGRESLSGER
jgi:hypothetical protein